MEAGIEIEIDPENKKQRFHIALTKCSPSLKVGNPDHRFSGP